MVADECVEIRSERGVVDSEEQRLASWLEAGQDAPERLGVVWTPVKNEKADSFVEPLLPLRRVSKGLRVSLAVCYIRSGVICTSEA